MKIFDLDDISYFKTIFSIYDNLTSYTFETITDLILTLDHVNLPNFKEKYSKELLFILLFLNQNLMNNTVMTSISNEIVNKINNYNIPKKKILYESSDDLVEINILLNNYFKEFDKFIIQCNKEYYDKLVFIVYQLHKLKITVFKLNNTTKLYDYLDRITKNIIDTLYRLDEPYILKNKLNQLILNNEVKTNLSSITNLLSTELFYDIYKTIEIDPENSIHELIEQFFTLYNKHIKTPMFLPQIKFSEISKNNDKLLNLLYKLCTGYETIIFKYFKISEINNFLYKYILEILYNPILFTEYKLSDDKVIILSFSIIHIIHNYFFSDANII